MHRCFKKRLKKEIANLSFYRYIFCYINKVKRYLWAKKYYYRHLYSNLIFKEKFYFCEKIFLWSMRMTWRAKNFFFFFSATYIYSRKMQKYTLEHIKHYTKTVVYM